MKIIQLTDLHLDQEGEIPFEIDVRQNFLRLLDAALRLRPDHLVITGDLCYREGEEEIYQWLYEQLEAQPLPYHILPGNHDNTEMMAGEFKLQHILIEGEFYFAKRLGKKLCLFLDTSSGEPSDRQLKWLRRQLRQTKSSVIIFMHHPPLISGVPFMDNKYSLKNMKAIQEILLDHPAGITVYCGHYHVERSVQFKNLLVQITPSCFFQIDYHYEDFKVDHHRVAFREIDIDHQTLRSSVRYFPGSK